MNKNMGYILIVAGIILMGVGIYIVATPSKTVGVEATLSSQKEEAKEANPVTVNSDLDENEQKGRDFEAWVVKHFSEKYWTINEWRGDKESDGRYAESNTYPDLELTLKTHEGEWKIAVECKWRKQFNDNGFIRWCKEAQLQRYNAFAKKTNLPVFVVIGVGGTPSAPESVYSVPLQTMKYADVKMSYLEKYKHDSAENFFYETEGSKLK